MTDPLLPPFSPAPEHGARTGLETWEEMKAYVGFTDVDAQRLRALAEVVEPHLDRLTAGFAEAVNQHEATRAIASGRGSMAQIQRTFRGWLEGLFQGEYGEAFYERTRAIGRAHVRVGLPERYMFTAMNLVRRDLAHIVGQQMDYDDLWRAWMAIARITDLQLAVMVSAYMEAHEAHQIQTLQDLIVENMPVTVLCVDDQGHVRSATRPGVRLFSGAGVPARHYEDLLPAELVEAADLPTHVGRALATNREITIPRVVLGEGTDARHFRITLVPLEHELARLLLHIEELTDVVQAEGRLRHTEGLARIGSLAANVAHEIRNPLAAISATLQVIVGSLGEDDRRKLILGKVQDQVHRLDRLVSDLLGYARPANAKLRNTRLRNLASEATAQAGVGSEVRIVEDCEVSADPAQAVQVLVNLLQNAREATGEQGRVWISVGPGPELIVSDDGPGIAVSARAHIFEPFYTTRPKGTGLGLAISRKLTEAMGGTLDLHPDTAGGRGAHFRVTFPPPAPSDNAAAAP